MNSSISLLISSKLNLSQLVKSNLQIGQLGLVLIHLKKHLEQVLCPQGVLTIVWESIGL